MKLADGRYVVQSGDSLATIALRLYGDSSEWRRLYEANRDHIRHPNMICPGEMLTVPGPTPVRGRTKQRSEMTPEEQLANPEAGVKYPIEFEVLELLVGVTALLRGLAKQGIKVFTRAAAKREADDVFKQVIDPKTGKKVFPNSPYKDNTRDPREVMKEINDQIEAEAKAALKSDRIGRQNAEIERIHKEFVETGVWPLKRKDLGDYHMGGPDAGLLKARQEYLNALKEHGP